MYKRTLLIDLDGVLNKYSGVYDEKFIPEIRDGAREFLNRLSDKYLIKIFSTRENNLVKKWIENNRLESFISGVTNIKEAAYLIIDDRCITFDGNFEAAIKNINDFTVWYKKKS